MFDDTDPTESSFLCMASVPLISLVHENDVRGLFELKRTDNTVNGQIEVALYWQDTYLPPLPGPLQVPSHVMNLIDSLMFFFIFFCSFLRSIKTYTV